MLADLLLALLYGTVQGITEWLPISSTGHLLLLQTRLPLPLTDQFRPFFLVAVQLGSLLALLPLLRPQLDLRRPELRRLWGKVACAVLPAGLCGLALDDFLDAHLSTPRVIAAALIGYGVLFLFLGRRPGGLRDPFALSLPRTVGVGCFQALALIPGTSRSGATILGGILLGLDRPAAARLSFFLAMPTMLAAAGLRAAKLTLALAAGEIAATPHDWLLLTAAALAAFAVSRAALRFLLDFVSRHTFAAFGIYRILLGCAVLVWG